MSDKHDSDFDGEEFGFDEVDNEIDDVDAEFQLDDLPATPDRPVQKSVRRKGANRPFVVIAGIMAVLFVGALGAILFIATQNNPTPVQLTSTAIVSTNQAVQVALNATETQASGNLNATQVAAAASLTPTASPTGTQEPTASPTGTTDPALAAAAQAEAQANAASTGIARETLAAGQALIALGLEQSFATEVSFQTREAQVVQAIYSTQVALATQGVVLESVLTDVAVDNRATLSVLEEQNIFVGNAAAAVETAFATRAAGGGSFATLVAQATPIAGQTQSALATFEYNATESARQMIATLQSVADAEGDDASADDAEGESEGVEVAQVSTSIPGQQIVVPAPALATAGAAATQAAIGARAQFIAEAIIGAESFGDPPTVQFISTELSSGFATEVAFATERAGFEQSVLATQAALAQSTGAPESVWTEIAESNNGTQVALQTQLNAANAAIIQIDSQLQTQVALNSALATTVALATPAAVETQAALGTAIAQVGQQAGATLQAVQTLVIADQGDSPVAFATQAAFMTPPVLSTAAAIATQAALAARAELIRQALLVEIANATQVAATPALDANSVALTATALALTLAPAPTQEGIVPTPFTLVPQITPLPTALPDTGLFDDLAGGGRDGFGMMALIAFGLLGVIVVSRRLRASNGKDTTEE